MYQVEVAELISEKSHIIDNVIEKFTQQNRIVFIANRETNMFVVFGGDDNSLAEAKFVADQLNKFYE